MPNVHSGYGAPHTHILEVAPYYARLDSEITDGSFVMQDGLNSCSGSPWPRYRPDRRDQELLTAGARERRVQQRSGKSAGGLSDEVVK